MKINTIERWIWILIYGGLLIVVIGLAVGAQDASLAWGLIVLGGMMAGLGFGGIYVRSRMKPIEK
jgi:hypothetical protein